MGRPSSQKRRPGSLAAGIRYYRELSGLTQEELAEAAGLSSTAMLETGARPNARESTLAAIAKALGDRLGRAITIADLRAGQPPETRETARLALEEFLASALGTDTAPEERAELRALVWPRGKTPTVRSWSFALEALRATKEEP